MPSWLKLFRARPRKSHSNCRLLLERLEDRNLLNNGVPTPDHVVMLIEENHAQSQIIGNASAPYINSLVNDANAALFTQSCAIQHPSQPNYLDLFSGSNQGVNDDGVPSGLPFTTPNLGAGLQGNGKSFVGYSEDLPSAGFTGSSAGAYARKHNPWVNWQGAGTNGIPAASNQPLTSFTSDFTALPTVSIVVPNQNNDMHDGSVAAGDAWLKQHLDNYIQWAKTHNSLFIMTFDEDDFTTTNQITTIFVGPMVQHGQYNERIDHFSLLRTLEDMYGLPYAGQSAAASPITDVWTGNSPAPTPTPTPVAQPNVAVSFAVSSDWGSGFSAKVSIKNNGATSIAGWKLEFDLAASIDSIWNAQIVSHTGSHYVVKDAAYNRTIASGATVSFGFNGSPGHLTAVPSLFLINGAPAATVDSTQSNSSGATQSLGQTGGANLNADAAPGTISTTFLKRSDWGSGFTADLMISNNQSSAINGWLLEFDAAFAINSIWNAQIVSHTGSHYVIRSAGWNNIIGPGTAISFGFNGQPGAMAANPTNMRLNGVPIANG